MAQIIAGFWLSRAVYVAAKFKLADALATGPKTAEDIAWTLGAQPASLYRLMRALASGGILQEDSERRFTLTSFGQRLRSDVPGSLQSLAMMELGDDHYESFSDLDRSVRTGKAAFEGRFEMSIWQHYSCDERAARNFDRAMTELSNVVVPSVVAAYDVSGFRSAVDVGGGQGMLLYSFLEANPGLEGILFDLPAVIKGGIAAAPSSHVNGRCRRQAGDMFAEVPHGGDVYFLKWILHDWDDTHAIKILTNVRRAIAPAGRLLAVESMIPCDGRPSFAKLMDLKMLVMSGGRERTEKEFSNLFLRAGFRLTRTMPVEAGMFAIEGVPV